MVDRSSNDIPSCLMLATELITPVSLASVFETEDLKDTGINWDSHVTLLYSKTYIDKDEVVGAVEETIRESLIGRNISGGFSMVKFLEHQQTIDPRPVSDVFELSGFENEDSAYVVLELKRDNGLYQLFSTINAGLMKKWEVKSDFPDYRAHITLAELKPGTSQKYIESDNLRLIVENSFVRFEDLVFSYDFGEKDYKQFDLTHNQSVERWFRIKNAREEAKELL